MVDRTLFSATFDTDDNGFLYEDDVFGTNRSAYADGARVATGGFGGGGALRVALGGVDNTKVFDGMSGGWERSFTVDAETTGTLTFRYNMSHLAKYDTNEFTEVRVAVDGVELPVVAHLDGGTFQATTGWQTVALDLGALAAGNHTLTIGGFNNRKTKSSEEGEILIDDVELTVAGDSGPSTPVLNLADLDGTNGYVISGTSFNQLSLGGDLNGDGVPDFFGQQPFLQGTPGSTVVVFGDASFAGAQLNVPALDGTNGFVVRGVDANDGAGFALFASGDINGDGLADLVIGAADAEGGPLNPTNGAGESYVVFGRSSGFDATVSLADLDGSNGFLLAGIDAFDGSGFSVSSAGDVNGDGFADILIGAPYADNPDTDGYGIYSGEAYVVFGRASGFAPVVDLSRLNGSDGYILMGRQGYEGSYDYAGHRASVVGDINGDGLDDIAVGGDNRKGVGGAFVVLSPAPGFDPVTNLGELDGSNGFHIRGEVGYNVRMSLSGAGDFNGDGFEDFIVGFPEEEGSGSVDLVGRSVVVFGRAAAFPATIDVSALDGTDGFSFLGIDDADYLGTEVFGVGDVNGDGLDDIIVSARGGDGGPGNPAYDAGESYLIFGRAEGFGATLDLTALSASQGLVIVASSENDRSRALGFAPGDINGDGFNDVLVGTFDETHVILGGDFTGAVDQQGDAGDNTLVGDADANVLIGAQGNDTLIGNGGADVLYGGQGDDHLSVTDASFQRVDGGTGTDTLVFGAPGMLLDLTAIADSKLRGIEQVDLNFDNNTLILTPLEVLNLSDNSNRLVVFGEAGDTVQADGDWVFQGFDTVDGANVAKYASGAAELWIEKGVTTNLPFFVHMGALGDAGFKVDFFRTYDSFPDFALSRGGDINGDGFDDFLIGASYSAPRLTPYSGVGVVIFGRASNFPAILSPFDIDGSNGAILFGVDQGDAAGASIAGLGDVDGDGLADFLIGAPYASGGVGGEGSKAGESYLIFGQDVAFAPSASLADAAAANGSILLGTDSQDFSGESVAGIGDFNGDGFADFVVGAARADGGPLNDGADAGESYVLFGRSDRFPAVQSLGTLEGDSGFLIAGIDPGDRLGERVSKIGDVNGDGLSDLLIVAPVADGGSDNDPLGVGEAYVLFGRAESPGATLDVSALDGTNGFVLAGNTGRDARTVAGAGDFNGDGFADLIVGDPGGSIYGRQGAGQSFIVFGHAGGFPAEIDLADLDQSDALVIAGAEGDGIGRAISGLEDINGDGFDDVILGARSGGPSGLNDYNPYLKPGLNYVVFGKSASAGSVVDLAALGAGDGFVVQGALDHETTLYIGRFVSSVGDINGDGFSDVAFVEEFYEGGAGSPTVIFGGDFTGAVDQQGDAGDNTLIGDADANVLIGAQGNDTLIGNGGADVLYGGQGDDHLSVTDASFQRVDGGTGTDTLVFGAPGMVLDLTGIADSKLRSIEQVDLNFENNTLILTPLEVLNLSDNSNRLVVFGEAGDRVRASGDWVFQGFDTADGVNVAKYASGAAELWIEDGIDVILSFDRAVVNLRDLDGDTGFVIPGIELNDQSGYAVSLVGDVNGDGFADFLIGAPSANGGPENAVSDGGESYLVFGRATGFGSAFELSSLNGTNGFIITGIDARDNAGSSVASAGDFDGDGLADLLVGAYTAGGGPDNFPATAGETYLIFGRASGFGETLDPSSLDGTTGLILAGIDEFDQSGRAISPAGDVNGDGFDDIVIGAFRADGGPANSVHEAGEAYIVFGRSDSLSPTIELNELNGTNGFTVIGLEYGGRLGVSVSDAGDVNGDGFSDVIIGANGANGFAGESYVIFGKASGFDALVDLTALDGANEFALPGVEPQDISGRAVSSAGDVNGDGLADLLIGAPYADGGPTDARNQSGESYVVFGKRSGFDPFLNLAALNGTDGFVIAGPGAYENSGLSLSSAGDVNGDGLDDIIVGAPRARLAANDPVKSAGESYVIFGRANGFGAGIDVRYLDKSEGFTVFGINNDDRSGASVSGGQDVNGDGYSDIIVGARSGDGGPGNARQDAGESYIVLGGDFTGAVDQQGDAGDNTLVGDADANVLIGAQGNDTLIGDGGADVLYGGQGDDRLSVTDATFQRVDGGAGTDTLVFGAPGMVLDLTAIADSKLRGVEQVDLNFENNTLILTPLEVLNLSDHSNRLVVFGEAGDTVQADGDWVFQGFDTADGADVAKYTSGAAELWVETAVTVEVAGPAAPIIESIADDTGTPGDGITSDNDLLVSGTALAGTTVEVFLNGNSLGTTLADGTTGAWFLQTGVIADGAHSLTATATDGAGHSSDPSAGFAIEIDSGGSSGPMDLIDADFDAGTDGFVYRDDAFGTSQPAYADGQRTATGGFGGGGALRVALGGVDNTKVFNGMSGGWERSFTLDAETTGTLTFRYNMSHLAKYDTNEFTEVRVAVDGVQLPVVAHLDGGTFQATTGWQTVELDLGTLSAGEHRLTIGGFNNRKTKSSEEGEILIDDVELTVAGDSGPSTPVLNLADLDGTNGFLLAGIDSGDSSGHSVSNAGDVNGDGFADLIVGAPFASGGPSNLSAGAGESYLVFGQAEGFGAVVELSSLDGINGFLLAGIDAEDSSGLSISGAGDVNGDGFADLIVGARFANGGPGNPKTYAGEGYVVFGQASGFASVFELSSLDGINGFLLTGIDGGDRLGHSVAGAGDVNGDGFADLIVGALLGDGGPGNTVFDVGESYVVFGQASGFSSVVDLSLLDGSNGFLLTGIDMFDYSGYSVSGAGDVNGDGFADLIVATPFADTAGESYVVFGKASGFGSVVDLSSLDGSNGFLLAGIDGGDRSGHSVSAAGDVNGDGFADLIVGTIFADAAGESYVVFGQASGFGSVVELSSLDGSNGFLLDGVDDGDASGFSVSGAGDVNGDGLDDMIVGAFSADGGPGNPANRAGESYLIFGRAAGFSSVLNLGALTVDQGVLLAGTDEGDASGFSVSGAGDVNGDGFADLIVGARFANGGPGNTADRAGESYVIFGSDFSGAVDQQGDVGDNTLTGDTDANVLIGGQGNDTLIGNGGADVLYGGQGDDILAISDATLQRLKGGTGQDTLRLDGPGFALDLTLIADLRIGEIEAIDLQDGAGAHSLTLDVLEVLNISDTSNSLTIFGDGADTVAIGAGWTSQGVAGAFETFTQGAATLEIDTDIVVTA